MRMCDIDEHKYENDRIMCVMTLSEITVSEVVQFDNVPTSSCRRFVDQVLVEVVNESFSVESCLNNECIRLTMHLMFAHAFFYSIDPRSPQTPIQATCLS